MEALNYYINWKNLKQNKPKKDQNYYPPYYCPNITKFTINHHTNPQRNQIQQTNKHIFSKIIKCWINGYIKLNQTHNYQTNSHQQSYIFFHQHTFFWQNYTIILLKKAFYETTLNLSWVCKKLGR